MNTGERKREQNWSCAEKDCLRELVNCHLNVVESKENDLKMIRKKKDEWEIIRMDMLATGFNRDVGKLKQQWVRMKVGAKKAISEVRRATVATGNFAKIPTLDESDLQMESMLQYEFLEDAILIDSDTVAAPPLFSGSPPLPKYNEYDEAKDDNVCNPTPPPTTKDKLVSRLQNLKRTATKADVLKERQQQICKESAHEDELHLLKVQKLRAEIAQQAEVHALKITHMKEEHALRCKLIPQQNMWSNL